MTPKNKRSTILAIDPGTRYMGIAVLDGDALIHHGVKTISAKLTPCDRLITGRKVVLRLLRDFRPDVVAIEKAFLAQNRNTALLNVLVDEIQAIARQRGLVVAAMAPSTIKRRIAGNGHATKRTVAGAVIERFPDLGAYRGQGRRWKERYHGNMFDAVAIGLAARAVEQTTRSDDGVESR